MIFLALILTLPETSVTVVDAFRDYKNKRNHVIRFSNVKRYHYDLAALATIFLRCLSTSAVLEVFQLSYYENKDPASLCLR